MSSFSMVGFGKATKESKEGKINLLGLLCGYLPLFLGFGVFVYLIAGLANTMDRIVYFLAGGDTFLGLLRINIFSVGSLISVGIFFLGLWLLSRGDPEKIQSKRNILLWRFGFTSGNWLLFLLTVICLAFLIWLALASFPLLYAGIRIGVIYSLIFLVLVWRSVVYFLGLKKRKG